VANTSTFKAEDEFVEDGNGGLVLTIAYWMPSPYAGLPVETDYLNAEVSLRMLLSLLTSDPHELSLARGLFQHELGNLPTSRTGWLLVRDWPDLSSWMQASQAPYGSIWASLQADNMLPESMQEGGFLVEALQIASDHGLGKQIGLPTSVCQAERQTFLQYLRLPAPVYDPTYNLYSLIRSTYPTADSQASDPPVPSDDPVDAAKYLQPITKDASFVCADWDWMTKYGITRDQGVGHVLLAWAQAETAWMQLGPNQCPSP
jgi:hypothetical protein